MRNAIAWALVVGFGLGAFVGVVAKKKLDAALYQEVDPSAAAANLLKIAGEQADDNPREGFHLARAYYLSGRTEKGQKILDDLTAETTDPLVWLREARLYYEAGEWELAESVFTRVLVMEPRNPDLLAEIGAYYNLHGDRERAEELFERSFSVNATKFDNTLAAAGSYAGVVPRR